MSTHQVNAQPIQLENEGTQLFNQAKNYVSKGDLSNAILVFNQAIQIEPRNLLYRRELAFTYFLQGDLTQAAQVCYPLMKKREADPETFLLASKIFRKANRLEEAVDAIRSGIDKFPNEGMLYEEKGQILLDKKKNKEAVSAWEKGVRKSPGYYLNYYNLARAYYFNKEYIWAIVYGEQFVMMESFSSRTEEIKKIIFESYKSLIAGMNIDEINNESKKIPAPSSFGEAYGVVINSVKYAVTGGVHVENLSLLRLRFLLSWNREFARRYPFELIDFQQRLVLNGFFECYNVWLFGKEDNEKSMKIWVEDNSETMNRFETYIRNNKLQPKSNQYYHN